MYQVSKRFLKEKKERNPYVGGGGLYPLLCIVFSREVAVEPHNFEIGVEN